MTKTLQQQIRKRGKEKRAALLPHERELAAQKIAALVVSSPWFQRSDKIACYLSVSAEVSTWRIIQRGLRMKKRIFAPITKKNSVMQFRELNAETTFCTSDYGLIEPVSGRIVDARNLDLVITPLVAFDKDNHRVGMGGGYFDRTFAFLQGRKYYLRPKLIGVAFACQEVEKIPPNPWDMRVFSVITENSRLPNQCFT